MVSPELGAASLALVARNESNVAAGLLEPAPLLPGPVQVLMAAGLLRDVESSAKQRPVLLVIGWSPDDNMRDHLLRCYLHSAIQAT